MEAPLQPYPSECPPEAELPGFLASLDWLQFHSMLHDPSYPSYSAAVKAVFLAEMDKRVAITQARLEEGRQRMAAYFRAAGVVMPPGLLKRYGMDDGWTAAQDTSKDQQGSPHCEDAQPAGERPPVVLPQGGGL